MVVYKADTEIRILYGELYFTIHMCLAGCVVSAQNFKAFKTFSSDQVTVLFGRENCSRLHSSVTAFHLCSKETSSYKP